MKDKSIYTTEDVVIQRHVNVIWTPEQDYQATIKTLRDELAHKTRRVEYLEKVILDINKSLKGRCDEK